VYKCGLGSYTQYSLQQSSSSSCDRTEKQVSSRYSTRKVFNVTVERLLIPIDMRQLFVLFELVGQLME